MIKKKVKAFTLAEVLVAMVIMVVIISLTFLALSLTQKYSRSIKENLYHQQEYIQFEKVILNDFNLRFIRLKSNNELILTNVRDTVFYRFKESHILRNKDTFYIKPVKKSFFLDGKEVQLNAIDALKLEFTSEKAPQKTIFVSKPKDASFYINQ